MGQGGKEVAVRALRIRLATIVPFGGEILWPKSLNATVGRLLGALSLLALARYSFDFGFSAAATKVFKYYVQLLRVLLGWTDPYLRPWIAALSARLNLHVKFNEYWHHIFVV